MLYFGAVCEQVWLEYVEKAFRRRGALESWNALKKYNFSLSQLNFLVRIAINGILTTVLYGANTNYSHFAHQGIEAQKDV